jgi:uncharacterized membrane protein/Mg-chelatase subunit ChlD
MLSLMQFDRPGWLLLLVLLIPIVMMSWRGMQKRGARSRVIAATLIRCVVVLLLAVAIARPVWNRIGDGLTLVVLLDRSQSIPRVLQDQSIETLTEWTNQKHREKGDRLSVISIGENAVIGSMPSELAILEPASNEPKGGATNLASGVQLALAILPKDTASRLLIVSDGNETDGQVLAAASLAKSAGVPIDVLPVRYEHENEVIVEQVLVSSQSRIGQTIPVRVVIRSIGESSGVLHILRNNAPIDVSPDEEGTGVSMALRNGVNAVVFDIPVNSGGPQRFTATWQPDSGTDTIAANNTGVGVTFVARGGTVLLVTENELTISHLRDVLIESGISVVVTSPEGIPRDSIGFTAYDAVVLADIPRWAIDDSQEQHLLSFVHDIGGGLIMTGGPTSFGAGGWIGSQLEQAMPIRCEPPQTRNLPRGALALIMHSCEMLEGNYWGQEVAGAAVEALSEQDFIGIVEYSWNSGTNANCDWTLPMQLAGDKVAAMDAVHSLTLGDMQDFDSALELSLEGLNGVDAAQRHVIIISDGDPQPPTQELIQSYRDASVTISTVMVGGHGSPMDLQMMQGIATATGGRFYMVNDPTQLPQIFIKEAQLNSRSLIQEGGPWDPSHIPSGTGPLQGINSIPPITGLVVTAGRGGLSQTPWVINSSDGDDPLYAWWHHGIGKSIAFTSDLGSQWTTQWPAWSSFAPFWQRSIQWAMRGSMPPNVMVRSRVEGGRGIVDIEAVDANASFLNLMQSHAVAIDPHGQSHVISVRQTGPGHYHAEFDMDQSGAWLVNVALQSADGDSTGAIPAAVSIPYPAEYSATTDNAVLLHELAQRTGGRMLSFDEIDSRNLFDREGLELPVSPKPVWDLLAILAASLLIIDIAIRRLWIDRKSMQTMLAPVAQATTSSVEALRRVHEQQEREQPKKEQPENVSPESPKEPSSTPKQEEQIERDDNLGKLLKRKRDRGDQGGDS